MSSIPGTEATIKVVPSELDKDLEELKLGLFGDLKEPKVEPAQVHTPEEIDDAMRKLADDALDNPDVVLDNIADSGAVSAFWDFCACMSWTGLGKLFSAMGSILFPSKEDIAAAITIVEPKQIDKVPEIEVKTQDEVTEPKQADIVVEVANELKALVEPSTPTEVQEAA